MSDAAGQAADAWALVEAMEAKGDAAAAADKAAQATALQQKYQQRQAAADAAASQAQQQVRTSGLGACYSTPCMASLCVIQALKTVFTPRERRALLEPSFEFARLRD